jgi:hypothetical protein
MRSERLARRVVCIAPTCAEELGPNVQKIKTHTKMFALIVCTRYFTLIEALDCSTFGRGLATSA